MARFWRSRSKANTRNHVRAGTLQSLDSVGAAPSEEKRSETAAGQTHNDTVSVDDLAKLCLLNNSDVPSFRFPTPPTSRSRSQQKDSSPFAEAENLWEVFTPSRPQTSNELFVGRRSTIERIIRAIEEEHAHVVLYGGRGIGKTSVANVVADSARRAGYHVARSICDSETRFEGLFQEFLRNIPNDVMDQSTQGKRISVQKAHELLETSRLAPTDLSNIFDSFIEPVILIIDEFDRAEDPNFNRKMSEAIKVISDSTDLFTIFIISSGRNIHELFENHLSLQRHIRAIRLPFMEDLEIHALLRQGEEKANIQFSTVVRDSIVALSTGTPYCAHLLGLLSGRHALARQSRIISDEDLSAGISDLLKEIDPSLVTVYEQATRAESNLFITDLLFASAAAPCDTYGTFARSAVSDVFENWQGIKYDAKKIGRGLGRLVNNEKAPILEKRVTPAGIARYEFINPLMRQYVLLRQFTRRGTDILTVAHRDV